MCGLRRNAWRFGKRPERAARTLELVRDHKTQMSKEGQAHGKKRRNNQFLDGNPFPQFNERAVYGWLVSIQLPLPDSLAASRCFSTQIPCMTCCRTQMPRVPNLL